MPRHSRLVAAKRLEVGLLGDGAPPVRECQRGEALGKDGPRAAAVPTDYAACTSGTEGDRRQSVARRRVCA